MAKGKVEHCLETLHVVCEPVAMSLQRLYVS